MTVAARLTAPAKLPPTDRKSFRNDFENKKADLENAISAIMGTQWTLDVDPRPIWPYLATSKFKGRIGEVILSYFEPIPHAMKWQLFYTYPTTKDDLNRLVPAHSISLDVDVEGRYECCGPTIRGGKIVIVFNPAKVCSSAGGFEKDSILRELAAAEAGAGRRIPLPVAAKLSISTFYTNDPEPYETIAAIRKALDNPELEFDPNFERVYSALKASGRDDADDHLAGVTKAYLADLACTLAHQFDSDDMQEAFVDAVPSNRIVLRVVPQLQGGGRYGGTDCEPWIEDGVLYLQTTAEGWGRNTQGVGRRLVELVSDNAEA